MATAVLAHDIDPKLDAHLYSRHSIRVSACVVLHIGGASAIDIKKRLRWKSDAFEMYLRDMPSLAALHRDIINRTNVGRHQ